MLAVQIDNEDKLSSRVSEMCDVAAYTVVRNHDDLGKATDLVKLIKMRHREIEDERVRLVKPFNDGVKQINARFKSMLEPLADAEASIKQKMLAFQQEESRKAAEARRIAEEQAAKDAEEAKFHAPIGTDVPAVVVALPELPKQTSYGNYGGVSTVKKLWRYEVVDMRALFAARPDLVMVDTVKINAEVRGKGGSIPGLRIFQDETISVR